MSTITIERTGDTNNGTDRGRTLPVPDPVDDATARKALAEMAARGEGASAEDAERVAELDRRIRSGDFVPTTAEELRARAARIRSGQ